MNWKYEFRTLRNAISRELPSFAHLGITHRCNLRRRFCHIPEEPIEELDPGGMRREIDVLDRLGVAVLSISGGGEPLPRKDFAAIVDYAAGKRINTKLTSNGAMPQERFQTFLPGQEFRDRHQARQPERHAPAAFGALLLACGLGADAGVTRN